MDDNTIMWFGKHKGLALANVPGGWMMWWYNANENPIDPKQKELKDYIKRNIQAISSEAVFKSY